MRHPFFASSRTLVFAHRGGGALAPENTIAAFDNGLALGADGLELDVHLSRDGAVVVHHDRLLNRTTPLAGPIAERTVDELRRVDIPTLAEVLERYRDTRIIVEMKLNRADGITRFRDGLSLPLASRRAAPASQKIAVRP